MKKIIVGLSKGQAEAAADYYNAFQRPANSPLASVLELTSHSLSPRFQPRQQEGGGDKQRLPLGR